MNTSQASAYAHQLDVILAMPDLLLVVDEVRGLAFLRVSPPPAPENPESSATSTLTTATDDELVRRQRLNTEQSLLITICATLRTQNRHDGAAFNFID